MFDPHEGAAARIRPARGIADRKHAFGRRLEVRVHDNALVDLESSLFGECGCRSDAGDDGIRVEPLATLEHYSPRHKAARRPPEVEYDAVLLVQGPNELTELRPRHALERTPVGRNYMHLVLTARGRRCRRVAARAKKPITLRLETCQIAAAKRAAARLRLHYQTLPRTWLAERLTMERVE